MLVKVTLSLYQLPAVRRSVEDEVPSVVTLAVLPMLVRLCDWIWKPRPPLFVEFTRTDMKAVSRSLVRVEGRLRKPSCSNRVPAVGVLTLTMAEALRTAPCQEKSYD